jgi:hypothetical protein
MVEMNNKVMVAILFTVMIASTFIAAGVMNTTLYSKKILTNNMMPLELKQTDSDSTDTRKLTAMLKGSIYESGEQMTVFGACFDGYGYLISDPSLNATISTWYPNGTAWEQNQYMTAVLNGTGGTTGRFRYQVNMGNTSGTYLTEITCMYQGDIANAYGEWQNPDWVKRIKDTQDSLALFQNLSIAQYNNVTDQILNFSNTVQNNFSQVMLMLDNLTVNINGSLSSGGKVSMEDLVEIYNVAKEVDLSFWAIDTEAPFYTTNGGNGTLSMVDMISPSDIYIANSNGVWFFDGAVWAQLDTSAVIGTFNDVSVLPANIPYAWLGTTLGYSINGVAEQTLPSTSNDVVAIKVFQKDAGSSIRGYALTAAGELMYTANGGVTWTNPINFTSTCTVGESRVSNVLWHDPNSSINNQYSVMATCGGNNEIIYYNGTNYNQYAYGSLGVNSLYNGFLLKKDIAYILETDGVNEKVLKFNGTDFASMYTVVANAPHLVDVAAAASVDIWVGTSMPGSFYHYDGINWEFSAFPYSSGIVIGVNNNITIPAITEMTLYNSRVAYAVSADGTVFKLYSNTNNRFDQLETLVKANAVLINGTYVWLNNTYNLVNATYNLVNTTNNNVLLIQNQMNQTYLLLNDTFILMNQTYTLVNETNTNVLAINASMTEIKDMLLSMNITIENINTNVNEINMTVTDIKSIVIDMNQSIMANLSEILGQIAYMNNTINMKLDSIITNITYGNLYLVAINATVSDIYQNTLTILSDLGIIKQDLNATLNIVNQTQQQVINISTGVDELVNKSRRIRAWVTV